MDRKNAFIFPGQGAQKVGMGKDFYDLFLESKEVFQEADDTLSFGLSKIIFNGPIDKLTKTRYSQPAIFVTSIAILKAMYKQIPNIRPSVTGGLSLGEYSALCAAEKLDFVSTLKVVAARGHFMQEACDKEPGVMLVVMGLNEEEIAKTEAFIANVNTPGQIVVACRKEDVEKITKDLQEKGAKKIVPLPVSGAFHTPLMEYAKENLKSVIEEMSFKKSDILLAMNVLGDFVNDLDEIKACLIEQVVSPTKWMKCVLAMEKIGVTHYYEFGPSQLSSMNKKIGVLATTTSVDTVKDLEQVYEISSK